MRLQDADKASLARSGELHAARGLAAGSDWTREAGLGDFGAAVGISSSPPKSVTPRTPGRAWIGFSTSDLDGGAAGLGTGAATGAGAGCARRIGRVAGNSEFGDRWRFLAIGVSGTCALTKGSVAAKEGSAPLAG